MQDNASIISIVWFLSGFFLFFFFVFLGVSVSVLRISSRSFWCTLSAWPLWHQMPRMHSNQGLLSLHFLKALPPPGCTCTYYIYYIYYIILYVNMLICYVPKFNFNIYFIYLYTWCSCEWKWWPWWYSDNVRCKIVNKSLAMTDSPWLTKDQLHIGHPAAPVAGAHGAHPNIAGAWHLGALKIMGIDKSHGFQHISSILKLRYWGKVISSSHPAVAQPQRKAAPWKCWTCNAGMPHNGICTGINMYIYIYNQFNTHFNLPHDGGDCRLVLSSG